MAPPRHTALYSPLLIAGVSCGIGCSVFNPESTLGLACRDDDDCDPGQTCAPDVSTCEPPGQDSDLSSEATTASTASDGTTDVVTATGSAAATNVATDDTAAGTEDSTGPPEVPMPNNGAGCDDDADCDSGHCYEFNFEGICSECKADSDCPSGGCSLPNPYAQPPVGASCNTGEPGAGCMSDAACQDGYHCATILEVPGIVEAATCGECRTDADCPDAQLCSPSYDDLLNFSGQKVCVNPGSVQNGEGCDDVGTGNAACASGVCATLDILGVLQIGVCGDCSVDVDCVYPGVCLPTEIDDATGTITPSTCGRA